MFKKIKILLLALIFSLFLFSFGLVDASIRPCLRTRANLSWPSSPLGTEITEIYHRDVWTPLPQYCPRGYYFKEGVDTPTVIRYFFEWMIVLGGLAVFIAFIWAGLLYMTSVGDANKMTEARKKIKNALIGLVLMLSSYLIFYTINPHLTKLREVTPGEIQVDISTAKQKQERIDNFVKAYSHCSVVAEMRAGGYIEIPVPLLRIRYNPFTEEGKSKIDVRPPYPNNPYHSFLGSHMIDGQITGGTLIGNCAEFRTEVINQQRWSFPHPFYLDQARIINYKTLIDHLGLLDFPLPLHLRPPR